MYLFKKKKIYRVKYIDHFSDVNITVVKATDLESACRKVEKRYPYPWYVHQILEIKEVR